MSQVSYRVRQLIKTQMAFAFNDRVDDAMTDYQLDPAEITWVGIDFTEASNNFLFGRINPDALEGSSAYVYPMVTIDTLRSASDPKVKFVLYGGRIQAVIEMHISWSESNAIYDFASWGDAFEDALYATMNVDTAFVGSNICYAKDIAIQRSGIVAGGRNWRQTLSAVCNFTLWTN